LLAVHVDKHKILNTHFKVEVVRFIAVLHGQLYALLYDPARPPWLLANVAANACSLFVFVPFFAWGGNISHVLKC